MSIKDLFDKGHSLKFVKNKTKDDIAESVESSRYIDVYSKRRDRFRQKKFNGKTIALI